VTATPAAALAAPGATYVSRLADTALVLGQRLAEWIGHAPAIEEDLGVANISLDLIGQARLLYAHAATLDGSGRAEDDYAYLREQADFLNATMAEVPNGDFGQTIVRQCLMDAWRLELYERLAQSADATLAAIAAKSVKEIRYHLRYSAGWLVRLGDGTDESHRRVSDALARLWPYVGEWFAADAVDETLAAAGIAPSAEAVRSAFEARLAPILSEARLSRPADVPYRWYGKRGEHTEHLGRLLADLQSLHRAHPGAEW
jgi:ring-1,2-phenylacetyl-CoA epoxidase subunit PaaC